MIDVEFRRASRMGYGVVDRIPIPFNDHATVEHVHLRKPNGLTSERVLAGIAAGTVDVVPMVKEISVVSHAGRFADDRQCCEMSIECRSGWLRHGRW